MTSYKKIAIIIALPIILWLISPFFVHKYIEKYYPYLTAESVFVYPTHVELTNVTVKKDNIRGRLNTVDVDVKKNVNIYGGEIDLIINKEKENVNPSNVKLAIHSINVNVTYDSIAASLMNVSYKDHTATFSSARIEYLGYEITSENCSVTNRTLVTCGKLDFDIDSRVVFPGIKPKYSCTIKNIHGDKLARKINADVIDCGDFKFYGLNINAQNKLGAHIDRIIASHKWLGDGPVEFHNVSVLPLNNYLRKFQIEINKAPIRIDLDKYSIEGNASCSDWADSLPEPKPEAIDKASKYFTGTFGFKVQVKPIPKLKLYNKCKFKCSSSKLVRDIVSPSFKYQAYNSKGKLFTLEAGPKTNRWAFYNQIQPHTALAFITLEDPGFNSHNGVIQEAIQNSFITNLQTGKFTRGGSTITMQLAKNIWLTREKTITRKAQEMLLTSALENCLTKEQILELYLNVVEFGPNIYGIKDAAKYYFGKQVSSLTAEESFYLASLMPNPRRGVKNPGLEYTKKLMGHLKAGGLYEDL